MSMEDGPHLLLHSTTTPSVCLPHHSEGPPEASDTLSRSSSDNPSLCHLSDASSSRGLNGRPAVLRSPLAVTTTSSPVGASPSSHNSTTPSRSPFSRGRLSRHPVRSSNQLILSPSNSSRGDWETSSQSSTSLNMARPQPSQPHSSHSSARPRRALTIDQYLARQSVSKVYGDRQPSEAMTSNTAEREPEVEPAPLSPQNQLPPSHPSHSPSTSKATSDVASTPSRSSSQKQASRPSDRPHSRRDEAWPFTSSSGRLSRESALKAEPWGPSPSPPYTRSPQNTTTTSFPNTDSSLASLKTPPPSSDSLVSLASRPSTSSDTSSHKRGVPYDAADDNVIDSLNRIHQVPINGTPSVADSTYLVQSHRNTNHGTPTPAPVQQRQTPDAPQISHQSRSTSRHSSTPPPSRDTRLLPDSPFTDIHQTPPPNSPQASFISYAPSPPPSSAPSTAPPPAPSPASSPPPSRAPSTAPPPAPSPASSPPPSPAHSPAPSPHPSPAPSPALSSRSSRIGRPPPVTRLPFTAHSHPLGFLQPSAHPALPPLQNQSNPGPSSYATPSSYPIPSSYPNIPLRSVRGSSCGPRYEQRQVATTSPLPVRPLTRRGAMPLRTGTPANPPTPYNSLISTKTAGGVGTGTETGSLALPTASHLLHLENALLELQAAINMQRRRDGNKGNASGGGSRKSDARGKQDDFSKRAHRRLHKSEYERTKGHGYDERGSGRVRKRDRESDRVNQRNVSDEHMCVRRDDEGQWRVAPHAGRGTIEGSPWGDDGDDEASEVMMTRANGCRRRRLETPTWGRERRSHRDKTRRHRYRHERHKRGKQPWRENKREVSKVRQSGYKSAQPSVHIETCNNDIGSADPQDNHLTHLRWTKKRVDLISDVKKITTALSASTYRSRPQPHQPNLNRGQTNRFKPSDPPINLTQSSRLSYVTPHSVFIDSEAKVARSTTGPHTSIHSQSFDRSVMLRKLQQHQPSQSSMFCHQPHSPHSPHSPHQPHSPLSSFSFLTGPPPVRSIALPLRESSSHVTALRSPRRASSVQPLPSEPISAFAMRGVSGAPNASGGHPEVFEDRGRAWGAAGGDSGGECESFQRSGSVNGLKRSPLPSTPIASQKITTEQFIDLVLSEEINSQQLNARQAGRLRRLALLVQLSVRDGVRLASQARFELRNLSLSEDEIVKYAKVKALESSLNKIEEMSKHGQICSDRNDKNEKDKISRRLDVIKANEVRASEGICNEVVRGNEVRANEVRCNEVRGSEVRCNEVRGSEVRGVQDQSLSSPRKNIPSTHLKDSGYEVLCSRDPQRSHRGHGTQHGHRPYHSLRHMQHKSEVSEKERRRRREVSERERRRRRELSVRERMRGRGLSRHRRYLSPRRSSIDDQPDSTTSLSSSSSIISSSSSVSTSSPSHHHRCRVSTHSLSSSSSSFSSSPCLLSSHPY
eukprot:GHVN01011049.1.p1 GENE.GHVN01011049.1~~GHVN01011049.1.p1  ORF type:complete len:1431 (-),score=457.05 GHVN01011049.1:262-4554(-)